VSFAGSVKRQTPAPLWFALGATGLGLAIGYSIKAQCALHPWAESFQYRHLCYNDIQPLFGVRGISKGLMPYRDVILEYPVLTGLFMDLCGRVLRGLVSLGLLDEATDGAYLGVSSLLLSPFALAVTLLLRPRVTRQRLMIWAVGTPIVLYAFHNWDLLAVAAAVWGLMAFEGSRIGKAGVALAAGASAKLYPAYLMPGAVLARYSTGDRRGAARLILYFLAVYLLINVPWMIISNGDPGGGSRPPALTDVTLRQTDTNGWLQVWIFHADRYPDFGSLWYWFGQFGKKLYPASFWEPGQHGYRNFVNLASLALFALGSLALLLRGWRRRLEPRGYPVAAVGFGIVCLFLLTSKVHSPQYALWVVPFLAMLNVPWPLVIGYLATDLGVFISGFYFFTVMDEPSPAWHGILGVFVWARAAALGGLLWSSLRATRLEPELPARPPEEGRAALLEISSRPG
jgi:uncharacterized membrane protein